LPVKPAARGCRPFQGGPGSEEVKLPAGYWITWGGQFQNLIAARKRLIVVVPIASLGFVPMAIAHGTGAEVQRPLARW
jgi:Cu/Ag efflux pump CusA